MSQQSQQPRTFTCFGCKQEIKLKRKEDDSGWLRFDMDGATIHNCPAKKKEKQEQQQQASQKTPSSSSLGIPTDVVGPQIATLAEHVDAAVKKLDDLTATIKQQNALLVALSNTVNKRQ